MLELWIAENEGAKFWLLVMSELKNRGIRNFEKDAWNIRWTLRRLTT
ncbi:transposase [Gluconobacter sphaericus]